MSCVRGNPLEVGVVVGVVDDGKAVTVDSVFSSLTAPPAGYSSVLGVVTPAVVSMGCKNRNDD